MYLYRCCGRVTIVSVVPIVLALVFAGTVKANETGPKNLDLVPYTELSASIFQEDTLSSQSQSSKTREITGRVVDETGEPMAGVNVVFRKKGSTTPVTMNISSVIGTYSLTIPDNVQGTISFTFIGTKGYTEEVKGQTIINATLQSDVSEVGEVVITGIFERKSESYTGATNTVKAEQLERFGNRDVLTTIRNIEPSFNILESNIYGSDPNRLPTVQIRGNTSLPNVGNLQAEASAQLNAPLVILDGFESTMKILQDMNENDIGSITILKDASATAIYGSRGANGVVVITTKQPKAGDMRITWRSDLTIEAPDLTSYDLLNAREKLELERKMGLYKGNTYAEGVELEQYYNSILAQVNKGVDTYWLSKPLQTGIGQKHSIRIEGGDRKFRYSATAQYNDINGVMIGSDKQTFNGGVKLMLRHKNLLFQNNLMVGIITGENSPYGSFSQYVSLNPYWTGYDDNGNVLKQLGYYGSDNYTKRWKTLPINPLYNATLNTFDRTKTKRITNNFSIEWSILETLKLRGQLGLTSSNRTSDEYLPASHTAFANYSDSDFFRKGSYAYGSGEGFSYDGSLNLTYNKIFKEKHVLFAGANFNIQESMSNYYSFKAEGFTNDNIDYLGAAKQYAEGGSPTGTESLSRSVGFAFNANYMYDNKYFADFSVRTDGSSQFGADKRFAPFWSLGIGWNLHEETFLHDTFINRLKLRTSVGTAGSQNFSSSQALSTYVFYTDNRYDNWTGSYLKALENPDLRWQQTYSYNIGTDVEILDSRISLSFDYYQKRTDGMISSINIPSSNGFSSYVSNIGEVTNNGFEFNLSAYLLRDYSRGISWNIGISGIHNVNRIQELSQTLKDAQKTMEENSTTDPNNLYREGYSMSTIWVVRSLGIDPNTGKELYVKKNGEITTIWDSEDLIDGGETTPDLEGSINTSFRRKNLSLTLSFGYRFGGQMYNSTLISKVENADYEYNVDSRVYDDRWQNPGDIAAFKSIYDKGTTYMSTRFVEEENTLTLQNVNIRYDLKNIKFVKDLGIESLALTGNVGNLFYLSTVRQERGTSYPFARNFSLGINVVF